jgi:lipid II:glycine glycyltransferase (peptidoglycan interpeptide bridge formation enzyme)
LPGALEVCVGEKFIYTMKDISADLDQRIEKLEKFRERLQAKIDGKVAVDKNAESLKRVSDSLTHAKDAKRALASSCCDQSCEYDLV